MDEQAKVLGSQRVQRQERERHWRRHVAAWRRSGLTQAEYCRQQGLAAADFSWWKSDLARRDAARSQIATRQAPASFVAVPVVTCRAEDSACEVLLRNGRRMRVGAACEPGWIAKLATALEVADPC
jgi:transposase